MAIQVTSHPFVLLILQKRDDIAMQVPKSVLWEDLLYFLIGRSFDVLVEFPHKAERNKR